jgi:hypothetical protein
MLPVPASNRLGGALYVVGAYVLHVPLITTAIFAIVALAAIFGRRASVIYWIGTIVLRPSTSRPDGEDPRLMRSNNTLAAVILGAAQVAFVLHAPIAGWVFAGLAALAAAVALAGFCFGCFLFYQFKINRTRLFRSNTQ